MREEFKRELDAINKVLELIKNDSNYNGIHDIKLSLEIIESYVKDYEKSPIELAIDALKEMQS